MLKFANQETLDTWNYKLKSPFASMRAETVREISDYFDTFKVELLKEESPAEHREVLKGHQTVLWNAVHRNLLSRKSIASTAPVLFDKNVFYEIIRSTVGFMVPSDEHYNRFGNAAHINEKAFGLSLAKKMREIIDLSADKEVRSIAAYVLDVMQNQPGHPFMSAEVNTIANGVWYTHNGPQYIDSLARAFKNGRIPENHRIEALMRIAGGMEFDGTKIGVSIGKNYTVWADPAEEALSILQDVKIDLTTSQRLKIALPLFAHLDFNSPDGLKYILSDKASDAPHDYCNAVAKLMTMRGSDDEKLAIVAGFLDDIVPTCVDEYDYLTGKYEPESDTRQSMRRQFDRVREYGGEYAPLVHSMDLLKALNSIVPTNADRPLRQPVPETRAAALPA